MHLDLKQLFLAKQVRARLLVAFKLFSKLLNLYREVIDDTAVIVCAAAMCCSELRRRQLMVVVRKRLFFI